MANYPSLYFGLACLNNLDNLNDEGGKLPNPNIHPPWN